MKSVNWINHGMSMRVRNNAAMIYGVHKLIRRYFHY